VLCIVPVLVAAGEGGDVGVCGVHVSVLALEGYLYCKMKKETTQRSRRHQLKHITTLVFQSLFQHDLPSKDRCILKVSEREKGSLPGLQKGFPVLCERNFPKVG